MSVVSDAAARAGAKIASGPDVWFVLVQYGPCRDLRTDWWAQPLYAVQFPQDLGRFRLWDDGDGFDVMFKYRGRWRSVVGAWRQLRSPVLDAAENRPCHVTTFGRRVLKRMGVKEWKAKRPSTSGTTSESGR